MNDPDFLRNRATEIRAMAELIKTKDLKSQYLEVATDYDRLAAEADRIARQQGTH